LSKIHSYRLLFRRDIWLANQCKIDKQWKFGLIIISSLFVKFVGKF